MSTMIEQKTNRPHSVAKFPQICRREKNLARLHAAETKKKTGRGGEFTGRGQKTTCDCKQETRTSQKRSECSHAPIGGRPIDSETPVATFKTRCVTRVDRMGLYPIV